MIWRGCGDVAALGEDRTVAGHCSEIVDVLPDIQLYFDRYKGMFTISSEDLVNLLVEFITVTNGVFHSLVIPLSDARLCLAVCGYIGLPIKVGGMLRIRRLALWDQAQERLTSLHPEFKVPLLVLDPKDSSHELGNVRLGVHYVIEPVRPRPSYTLHVQESSSQLCPRQISSLPQSTTAPVLPHDPRTRPAQARRIWGATRQGDVSTHESEVAAPPRSASGLAEYTSDERFQAVQDWLYAQYGHRPEYRSLRLTTKNASQVAVTLLQWVKFAKEVKDAGPIEDEDYPAAQGLSVTNAALGIFLDRGHDWIKDALDAQDAIDSGEPAVGALTAKLTIKGIMLGAKTLAKLCIAARDGQPLPSLPRRGRGKTGKAVDTDSEEPSPRQRTVSQTPPRTKPKPRPAFKTAPKTAKKAITPDLNGMLHLYQFLCYAHSTLLGHR